MNKTTLQDSSQQPSINSVLKTALSNLDLDLERELERYRRLRGEKPVISKEILAKKFFSASPKSTKLVNLPLEKINSPDDTSSADSPKDKIISDASRFDRESISFLVHQPSQTNPEDLLTASDNEMPPPDDYLESSENLLRSLAEEERSQNVRSNPSKITPVGIAAIFLFSITLALLSFVWISENLNLSYLNLNKLLVKKGDRTTTESTNSENRPAAPIANNPNIANAEFVDLNLANLSTANTLKSKPSPTVKTNSPNSANGVSNQVATSEQSNTQIIERGSPDLATALLPPSLLPQSPQAYVVAPTQTTSPTPEQTTTSLPPASLNDKFYYVLVDYTGDPSLQKARKIDKNSYLRQFPQGMRIQVGAFDKKIDADKLVERLKPQGLSPYVYRAGQ